MDELRAISTFVRAAELGSFNRAAESQNSTPQAVSKAIRQLEQHLGVRLFHRTTRNSSLTEEGERLLEAVRPNLEGLVGALTRARSAVKDDEGLIRVTAAGSVGRKVVMPLLIEFQALHPQVHVDLLLEDRATDWVTHRIDVGFRAGMAPDAQVITRQLFPIQQLICAAPAYLAQHGAPASLQALAQHRCTGYRQPGEGRAVPWEFRVDGEMFFQPMPAVLCCSDPEAEMHAVLAGAGIGQIDSINASAPIREGRLVPVLLEHASARMGLHLYYAQRADMPGRVRRLIDFVIERLKGSVEFNLSAQELEACAQRYLNS